MAGTSVEDPTYVYGPTGEWNAYAGEMVVAVGVRDVVIDFTRAAIVNFAWTLDLTGIGYGAGIFYLGNEWGPFDAGTQETCHFEYDVPPYSAQVMAADYYGDWNTGTCIGSQTGGGAVTIASGEMYFIVESNMVSIAEDEFVFVHMGIVQRLKTCHCLEVKVCNTHTINNRFFRPSDHSRLVCSCAMVRHG
ncbi:MAG: hypothetical protein ACI9JK_001615 [Phycisphaerales bacterium]|jgi:hypothetical protein